MTPPSPLQQGIALKQGEGLRYLSVYSGIGMHDLGFTRAGWTCVGQIEWDDYCQAVLEKHWPGLPRWKDVRDVSAESIRGLCGRIDLITGGFVCKSVSVAGKRTGLDDRTSETRITFVNLLRLIRGIRPFCIVLENSDQLRARGYDRIVRCLERIGYAIGSAVVNPWWLGSSHSRPRIWIVGTLANAGCFGSPEPRQHRDMSAAARHAQANKPVDAMRIDWPPRPQAIADIPRAVDGPARRMERLTAIGNGNPPAVAELIARAINYALSEMSSLPHEAAL